MEKIRKLIDLAVGTGRKLQSPQTGFIHYHPHAEEKEQHHTIPIVENALFALALFRTRTAENVTEAKGLIDRLLYFQNQSHESLGNFPIFLHDYPQCKDRYLGIQLLPPFFWILNQFQQVLGTDLKSRLEKSARLLLEYCLKAHADKPAPPHISVKLGASAKALGALWQKKDLEAEGERILNSLINDRSLWGCPAHLGEMVAALQMVYPRLSDSPWSNLWNYLGQVWHVPSCSYTGPALRDYQEGFEPQPNLFDLYMGYFSNAFSNRSVANYQPYLLQGALIQPVEEELPLMQYPMEFQGILSDHKFRIRQTPQITYALVERKEGWNQAQDKSFHPLKILWGSPQRAHTFVCQGGNHHSSSFVADADKIQLSLVLGDVIQVEDREKNREVAFYLDLADETSMTVNDIQATTFLIGDEIKISSPPISLELKFKIEEGEGHFMGHFMRGNRPSQVSLKGEKRYNAFDWQIFLRTVRRSDRCRIGVQITII